MNNFDFITNANVNESNSLVDLMQSVDPKNENEIDVLKHSKYYNDKEFKKTSVKINGELRILNLNCCDLKSKFDQIKIFLANYEANNNNPISVITLQETHISQESDSEIFYIPDYTFVSECARINSFGGVAMFIHNDFSFKKLSKDMFMQTSTVFESMIVEIFPKNGSYKKYLIYNLYRRPSNIIDDLMQFNNEFSEVLHNIHNYSKNSYITADFNIDLLKIRDNPQYNNFYENSTSQGFFPQITRPTRITDNSFTLIDNILTNNICADHTSGILINPISDHFMNFCILHGTNRFKSHKTVYRTVENISPKNIKNLQNSLKKQDILSHMDASLYADPNVSYNTLLDLITKSKNKHIPKKTKKLNMRKDFKEKWMTKELLSLVNKKNDLYRDWKQTTDEEEYLIKKVNFKTFESIVEREKQEIKYKHYYDTFLAQKMI